MHRFQLDWRRLSDRFEYDVLLLTGEDGRRILSAPALPAGAGFPGNAPWQYVEHPTETLWLGVGMSGPNHWSASIELRDDRIEFDFACRLHDFVPLGSVYVLPNDDLEWIIDEGTARTRQGAPPISLATDGIEGWSREGSQLVLRIPIDSAELPCTRRWKHTLSAEVPPRDSATIDSPRRFEISSISTKTADGSGERLSSPDDESRL